MDFSRYTCQLVLPGFSSSTQDLLQRARVLIVGAGGLGCPCAQYLAASGTGTLGIVDFDKVSVSNLHRQVLYTPADEGLLKAGVAAQRLQAQNPGIRIVAHTVAVTADNVMQFMDAYDVIIDCTDNFGARYLLNDAAVLAGKPVIYGSIYQFEGQVAVWNVVREDGTRSANYRDLFPAVNALQIPDCTTGGVIPTIAGIIGCMQANEAIKYITRTGELLAGRLLLFDARTMQSRVIQLRNRTGTIIKDLPAAPGVRELVAEELGAGLALGRFELIDVRTAAERERYSIGGEAIALADLEENLKHFKRGKTYVFYCSSGKRSAEAVKLLQLELPHIDALSLQGGTAAWIGRIG